MARNLPLRLALTAILLSGAHVHARTPVDHAAADTVAAPIVDWSRGDFRCLRRASRLLSRVAVKVRDCRGRLIPAPCEARAIAIGRTRLATILDGHANRGGAIDRCLLGACASEAGGAACLDTVLPERSGTADEPSGGGGGGGPGGDSPGSGGDPPSGGKPDDLTANEQDCIDGSIVVLRDFDERVAKCRANLADKGPTYDFADCLSSARDKRESKLIGLLEKRVRPEVCLPAYCTASMSPEACARAALDAHAPESASQP